MPFSGETITLGLAAIAAIVWLVRLEGRVNTGDKTVVALSRDLEAANRRVDAEAQAHRTTADSLIRVEEQLKYMRELLERYLTPSPSPVRRRAPGK